MKRSKTKHGILNFWDAIKWYSERIYGYKWAIALKTQTHLISEMPPIKMGGKKKNQNIKVAYNNEKLCTMYTQTHTQTYI